MDITLTIQLPTLDQITQQAHKQDRTIASTALDIADINRLKNKYGFDEIIAEPSDYDTSGRWLKAGTQIQAIWRDAPTEVANQIKWPISPEEFQNLKTKHAYTETECLVELDTSLENSIVTDENQTVLLTENRADKLPSRITQSSSHNDGRNVTTLYSPNFDPRQPAKVMVVMHGLKYDQTKAMMTDIIIQAEHALANTKNIVMIFPDGPEISNHYGWMLQPGQFEEFITEINQNIQNRFGSEYQTELNLYLHSASGYIGAELAKRGQLNDVNSLMYLDASYPSRDGSGWLSQTLQNTTDNVAISAVYIPGTTTQYDAQIAARNYPELKLLPTSLDHFTLVNDHILRQISTESII